MVQTVGRSSGLEWISGLSVLTADVVCCYHEIILKGELKQFFQRKSPGKAGYGYQALSRTENLTRERVFIITRVNLVAGRVEPALFPVIRSGDLIYG